MTHTHESEEVLAAVASLLRAFGRSPDDPGVQGTPARFERMLRELRKRGEFQLTTFPANGTDQMIVMTGIRVWSFCEHHLLPFYGEATVGYLPDPSGTICGLSKLARVVDRFALRPQTQEYLTQQVAGYLQSKLNPFGVGVHIAAEHLCMSMRGVQRAGARTSTTALTGVFRTDSAARAEFLQHAIGARGAAW